MTSQEIKKKLRENILSGEFGIEKESLRVTGEGTLALTNHPDMAGYHMEEQISRDFAESQLEFVSRVHTTVDSACQEICFLQSLVEEEIRNRKTGREYVWTYSNPPGFSGEKNIRIAEFKEDLEGKNTYRHYLSEKYGRVKMLFSGVHLNFSMPEEFFVLLRELTGEEIQTLKNEWYLNLLDCLMDDSWLLVALTSASPVAEPEFLTGLGVPREEWNRYASFRNSKYGYWNLFIPCLSYRDFTRYLSSVEEYIKQGVLSCVHELYYPFRLKSKGENTLENLKNQGVNHIELRMLDLNLMSCAGVAKEDLIFIHLLIAYRIFQILETGKKVSEGEREGEGRILLHQRAAELDFWEKEIGYRKRALKLLGEMKEFYTDDEGEEKRYIPKAYPVRELLSFQENKILYSQCRYSQQILDKYKNNYINGVMEDIKER